MIYYSLSLDKLKQLSWIICNIKVFVLKNRSGTQNYSLLVAVVTKYAFDILINVCLSINSPCKHPNLIGLVGPYYNRIIQQIKTVYFMI